METCEHCGLTYDAKAPAVLPPFADGQCAFCGSFVLLQKIAALAKKNVLQTPHLPEGT